MKKVDVLDWVADDLSKIAKKNNCSVGDVIEKVVDAYDSGDLKDYLE
jgi:predicted DNA-binding ribbon-helix-helix protein